MKCEKPLTEIIYLTAGLHLLALMSLHINMADINYQDMSVLYGILWRGMKRQGSTSVIYYSIALSINKLLSVVIGGKNNNSKGQKKNIPLHSRQYRDEKHMLHMVHCDRDHKSHGRKNSCIYTWESCRRKRKKCL